jgi:hypothetical protein
MSREIETDGFITRAEDLKGSEPKPTWDALSRRLDNLIPPPPYGAVYITEQGLVLMCKGTYKMLTEGKEQDYEEVFDMR